MYSTTKEQKMTSVRCIKPQHNMCEASTQYVLGTIA